MLTLSICLSLQCDDVLLRSLIWKMTVEYLFWKAYVSSCFFFPNPWRVLMFHKSFHAIISFFRLTTWQVYCFKIKNWSCYFSVVVFFLDCLPLHMQTCNVRVFGVWEPLFDHIIIMWPWVNYLISYDLQFPYCKVGMIMPVPQSLLKQWNSNTHTHTYMYYN